MEAKRIEHFYDTLQDMKIELVEDTTLVSSSYLTVTLAKCDDYIQKTDEMLTEVLREIGALERKVSDQTDIYDAMLQETLQKDPEVQAMGTGLERTNAAKFKLRNHWKAIKNMEADIRDLETVQKVIERKGKRLSSAIVSVKKQWDSNIDSAKYLNLNPRMTTDDQIFTSRQASGVAFEDPALQDLVDTSLSTENKSSNAKSEPIIDETGDGVIEDLLNQI